MYIQFNWLNALTISDTGRPHTKEPIWLEVPQESLTFSIWIVQGVFQQQKYHRQPPTVPHIYKATKTNPLIDYNDDRP